MTERLILVSNDDGPNAAGIHALIQVAKEFGKVVAVGPNGGQSGKSHSITMDMPLRMKQVAKEDGYEYYTVSGTPVDSIKLALDRVVDRKPDLVLSGINHGSNAAVSVIYSGTMGVALEAALHNIPAIGFSLLNHSADADFTLSKQVARTIIKEALNNAFPSYTALNVNIPDIKPEAFKGIRMARQCMGVWSGEFDARKDTVGRDYFWMTGDFHNREASSDETDEYVLRQNMVAIVPVKPDLTDREALESMKHWKFD